MAKPIPQSRNVIAAFSYESKRGDKKLNIPSRGSIMALVSARLSPVEQLDLIGVKDSTGNNWID